MTGANKSRNTIVALFFELEPVSRTPQEHEHMVHRVNSAGLDTESLCGSELGPLHKQ